MVARVEPLTEAELQHPHVREIGRPKGDPCTHCGEAKRHFSNGLCRRDNKFLKRHGRLPNERELQKRRDTQARNDSRPNW